MACGKPTSDPTDPDTSPSGLQLWRTPVSRTRLIFPNIASPASTSGTSTPDSSLFTHSAMASSSTSPTTLSQPRQSPPSSSVDPASTTLVPSDPASDAPVSDLPPASADPEDPARATADARAAFLATLQHAGGSRADAVLQGRARDIAANASVLAKQDERVTKETADLARTGDGLSELVDAGGKGLKEVGDVQNWAEMLERELQVLEETVRIVEAGEEEEEEGVGREGNVEGEAAGKKKGKGKWWWGGRS